RGRLRAGPGLRLDRDGRRPHDHGGPPGGAPPRGPPRHRRPDPARRQARRPRGPRRLLLHGRGGGEGPAPGGVAGGGGGGGAPAPRTRVEEPARRGGAGRAAGADRPGGARGIRLLSLTRELADDSVRYAHVRCAVARARGLAEIEVAGPPTPPPADVAAI